MIRLQLCHAGFLPAALPYHCELKCQMSVHPQMSVRHFDLRPTFEEDGPIDMAWYLGSSRHIRTCRRIIRLQLGQGGFLETRTWTLETRTWTLVPQSPPIPNSGGMSCQSSHSPTHPNIAIPTPRCRGKPIFAQGAWIPENILEI